MDTGEYIQKDKNATGGEVVRFDTKKKYTKEELAAQREEFSKAAKEGKVICISDLMCNHGM